MMAGRTAALNAVSWYTAVFAARPSARDRGRRSPVLAIGFQHPAERGMALERGAERAQMLRGRPGWRVRELRREHDRREERGGGQVRDAERVAHEMARGPQLGHDPVE